MRAGRKGSPEGLLGVLIAESHYRDLALAHLGCAERGFERELVVRTHDVFDPFGLDGRGSVSEADTCLGIRDPLNADDNIQVY